MSVRQRALVTAAATLGFAGVSIGGYVAQAPEHPASEVQVEDGAEILYEPDLREGIEEVRFFEPTTVAVFTTRGGQEALTDDYALNNAVLDYARTTRTDWLSDDEQKWADDLYIFAIDPEGRLVGTYFGENRAIGEDAQLDVQDATKDELRAGQWTAAAVTGVEAAAAQMNAPWFRHGGGIAVGTLGALGSAVGGGIWTAIGALLARRSRAARAAGDEAMASVVADHEVTELHARLIPDSSRYGGLMLRRYDDYLAGFRELTELGNEVRGIKEKDYVKAENVKQLEAYRDKAVAMDHLDDVIADTSALLNRDRAWPQAWRRQVDPVRAELEAVDEVIEELPEEVRGLEEVHSLRRYASQALVDLDHLRGALEHEQVSPDDALDRLREIRDELGSHLDGLTAPVISASSEDEEERELMEVAMRREREIRHREPTIIATAHPTWVWYSILSFRSGYDQGAQDIVSSQSASSGSTSGYSGGGSFSGAGSSSRF